MNLKKWIKSKLRLDPRIATKRDLIKDTIEDAKEQGRFSFYEFCYCDEVLKKCENLNDYEKYKFFYEIVARWDEACNFSRESGERLNELIQDKSNVLAIHRSNLGVIEDRKGIPFNSFLYDIMDEGLINNGHLMQGVDVGIPTLSLTTTPITSITGLINLVASYKNNNVTVILQFPNDLVKEDLSFRGGDFYKRKGELYYIEPEYIVGAVVKNKNGFDKFYSKEELLSVKSKTK